jgi:hypothetical protein
LSLSVVVVVVDDVVLVVLLACVELAIDPLSVETVVELVLTGGFMSLLALLVRLPVPVEPVFEPALAGVPAMSVELYVSVLLDAMLLLSVDVVLELERHAVSPMTSRSAAKRVRNVCLRIVICPPIRWLPPATRAPTPAALSRWRDR